MRVVGALTPSLGSILTRVLGFIVGTGRIECSSAYTKRRLLGV